MLKKERELSGSLSKTKKLSKKRGGGAWQFDIEQTQFIDRTRLFVMWIVAETSQIATVVLLMGSFYTPIL